VIRACQLAVFSGKLPSMEAEIDSVLGTCDRVALTAMSFNFDLSWLYSFSLWLGDS
jgi:hypothetical protein